MAKFVVTIEAGDEDTSSTEVVEKIDSGINKYNMHTKSIARIRPHAIYSETDVPSKVFWNFDGFEDLEFVHLEKQRDGYVDEAISVPLHNDWLHCTCGELHNASPEEAIEHLKKKST